MKNGGKRKGAGRKPGTKNKSTLEVKALIGSVADMSVVVGKLYELTQGVLIEKTFKTGEKVIYQAPPDAFAAKILMEYMFGKPTQSVDLRTPDGVRVIHDDI